MPRLPPLGKKQLNDQFYGTVDPAAAFGTEVQVGFHQVAVARLVVRHAAGLGKRVLRILELGASTCLFANAFLEVVDRLAMVGEGVVRGDRLPRGRRLADRARGGGCRGREPGGGTRRSDASGSPTARRRSRCLRGCVARARSGSG